MINWLDQNRQSTSIYQPIDKIIFLRQSKMAQAACRQTTLQYRKLKFDGAML